MSRAVNCRMVPINRLLSSVTVKRRKSWLLAASALASSSLGISGPALARTNAGHLMPPATLPALRRQPLSHRHHLQPANAQHTPLNVTLKSDVNVTIPAGSPG